MTTILDNTLKFCRTYNNNQDPVRWWASGTAQNLGIIGAARAGIGGHHYGDKILSYRENQAEEAIQAIRDKTLMDMKDKVDTIVTNVTTLNSKLDKQAEILKQEENLSTEVKTEIEDVLDTVDIGRKSLELAETTLNDSLNNGLNETGVNKGLAVLFNGKQNLNTASSKLQALLDRLNNRNNFWGESELKAFYDYLDSLSLIQELALINSAYMVIVTITVLNIYSVVFSNEILRYFNIEEKYPRLQKFFSVRRTYQRYYLSVYGIMFIIFTLFIGGLNILTLAIVK